MLSNKPLPVKAGDNIPLNGRIEVKEWDPDFENADGSTGAYVDVTATQDFALWAIEADLKNMAGAKVADFSPTISADGLYIDQVTSAVTQTLPGTRLLVTDPTAPTAGGAEVLTVTVANVAVANGEVWIGYVCNGASGTGCETDSGGTLANGTIMLNGGEVNYASPPATAGLWPGSPGPYSNVPSLSFDYLYTP